MLSFLWPTMAIRRRARDAGGLEIPDGGPSKVMGLPRAEQFTQEFRGSGTNVALPEADKADRRALLGGKAADGSPSWLGSVPQGRRAGPRSRSWPKKWQADARTLSEREDP